MTVLLVAGSPSEKSRSAALLDAVQQRLRSRAAHVERLPIRDTCHPRRWAWLRTSVQPLCRCSAVMALVKSTEVSIAKL